MDSPVHNENAGDHGEDEEVQVPDGVVVDYEDGDSSENSTAGESNDEDIASEASSDEGSETSSNASSNGDENEDREEELLYEGARLTVGQSLMAILTLAMAHSLTGVCLGDLLALIALHCPQPNKCILSLYKFKEFFSNVGKKTLVFHYFCEVCFSKLTTKETKCVSCKEKTVVAYFIEIPLLAQLQRLFIRPGFYEDLQYRFNRRKRHPNNVEDVLDGNLYKSEVTGGFLNDPWNISFMWYTDGIAIFNSSKFSIWPLYYVINELPYVKRVRKENIILAGLWFGSVKPKVNLFLDPFHTSLQEFEQVGHQLNVPDQERPVLVKGKLLCGTCDLQAKAIFLRMKSYNAYFGCAKCKSRGIRIGVGRTTVHAHGFNPNDMMPRTNQEIDAYSRIAVQHNGSCYGVKGPSLLYDMMGNMIVGTGIDIMHGIFINLMRLFMKLWFDPSFSAELYSISGLVDLVDERLKSIKPPGFVQKMPRSIKTDIKLWKAAEFKLFFFYYAPAVLKGVWDEDNQRYFHHFLKLITAIYLLSQRSIFPEQIDYAETLLTEFVQDFEVLYGTRYMGMNVHQLLHLAQCVRDLGPTFVYACFFLEDLNGGLARLIHGTRYVGMQVCSSATMYMSLSTMVDKLPLGSEVRNFCERLSHKTLSRYKVAEVVSPVLKILGTYRKCAFVPNWIRLAIRARFEIAAGGHYQYFTRIMNHGLHVLSEQHKVLKTSSLHVQITVDNVPLLAKVLYFIRWSRCGCPKVCHCVPARFFALIQVYERVPWFANDIPRVRLSYMSKVVETQRTLAVDITTELNHPCFYMNVENEEYIATPVNLLEIE